MIISYIAGQFVKIQFGDVVVAINPPSKDSKIKATKSGADIALSTMNHPDFNGFENVSHGDRTPFAISGPGEYEIKGIVIRGFASRIEFGGEKRINTIYTIVLEGMKLCFLGSLTGTELPKDLIESSEEVDILLVPIGDGGLSPAQAAKIAVSIEPKLVIPLSGEQGELKQFLKEAGSEKIEPTDKLTLKKKDLEGKEGDIAVLKPLS